MRGRKPAPKTSPIQPVTIGFPECPKWLGKSARVTWNRIRREMAGQLISALDLDLFAAYCEDVALFQKSSAAIRRQGELIPSPNGHKIQNPWLAIRNRAQQRMQKSASELGLTPVSRNRLGKRTDTPSTSAEPIEAFLTGANTPNQLRISDAG